MTIKKSVEILVLAAAMSIAWISIPPAIPVFAALASDTQTQTHNSINHNDNEWTWRWRENGIGIEMVIRGKAGFNDDYSDVVSISSGGVLRVKDDRGGTSRRLEIESDSNGLRRTYSVDGQTRPYDAEAGRWFAEILTQAVRRAGLDASNRARRILAQRGGGGLLSEISLIDSDFVKRLYFTELIAGGNLDAGTVRQALAQIAREMKSDFEKAQVMTRLAQDFLNDEGVREAYVEAVGTIRSDFEKRRVLSALLKQPDLRSETLLAAIRTLSPMRSDFEKTTVLTSIPEASLKHASVRQAYVESTTNIRSDFERARALSALLKGSDVSSATLIDVIKAAAGMSSDFEKARVLVNVASINSTDDAVRNALVEAARSIKSEFERGRVLNAVFK